MAILGVFYHKQIGTVRGNVPFLVRPGVNPGDVISLCCSMLLWNVNWNLDQAHGLGKNEYNMSTYCLLRGRPEQLCRHVSKPALGQAPGFGWIEYL